MWSRFFESAGAEIDILAYSALWLAEDSGLLGILADKASHGVHVRIAMGDPDCARVAQRGQEEGICDAMSAKVRNALTLFSPLTAFPNVELRMHQTVLYNSIYRADHHFLVNQHTYGFPARSPVFSFRPHGNNEMTIPYTDSFDRIWSSSHKKMP